MTKGCSSTGAHSWPQKVLHTRKGTNVSQGLGTAMSLQPTPHGRARGMPSSCHGHTPPHTSLPALRAINPLLGV